ncbi:MAG: cation transporter [Nitrospirota bacterium]|jgi:divalent metal cation (Fe/Co/Zn/Cd) transporter
MNAIRFPEDRERLYRWAAALALVTVSYNFAEGLVSLFFGLEDKTFALMGFGLDSFVEVISGVGIWHMVRRIRRGGQESPDRFEARALRITGGAFYLLAAGLAVTSVVNLVEGHAPVTTFWGIVVALVSIATMWLLIRYKMGVGLALRSEAIVADAACTRTCLYLSVILLLSSGGYELTGIGGLDSLGALLIALLAFREGREAFQKARGKLCSCAAGTCPGPEQAEDARAEKPATPITFGKG